MSWETAAKKTGWKNWQERKTPRTFAAMKFSRWYVSLRVLLSSNKVLISMKYDSCIRLFQRLSSLVLRTLVAIYGRRNVIKLEDLAPFGENGSMCRKVAFCFSFSLFIFSALHGNAEGLVGYVRSRTVWVLGVYGVEIAGM